MNIKFALRAENCLAQMCCALQFADVILPSVQVFDKSSVFYLQASISVHKLQVYAYYLS